MKIKHQELEIPESNPFENCKLNRENFGNILTDIVKTYKDGFVLAINNEWGTGKTTFIKMWQQSLKNQEFQTVYFNAWENDFDDNALTALMSELSTLTNRKNEAIFKSVVKKGAVLIKNVAPILAKSIMKKYGVDLDSIAAEIIEKASEGAASILEEEIKEFAKKKKTIVEFRRELERFIAESTTSNPLVFIIDELDRCRPNYAVEVLEQMKHFFTVPGIVFVLSIDKNHLSSSVKGYYGSEHINTSDYLRRFIDLECCIPKPSIKEFCNYLFQYYSLNDFFNSAERKKHQEFRGDADQLLIMAINLFSKSGTTLRVQEKIFSQTSLILKSFHSNQYIFSQLLFLLIYIKNINIELFNKIENKNISIQGLCSAFEDLVINDETEYKGIRLLYLEALLLYFYNNSLKSSDRILLTKRDVEGNVFPNFSSHLLEGTNELTIVEWIDHISKTPQFYSTGLDYLIDRINLTESIKLK